jgi:hypothetical protein
VRDLIKGYRPIFYAAEIQKRQAYKSYISSHQLNNTEQLPGLGGVRAALRFPQPAKERAGAAWRHQVERARASVATAVAAWDGNGSGV